MEYTICSGCDKEKEADRFKRCNICREKRRLDYQKNKEKENAQARAYHAANKEKINARHAAYNAEHAQQIKEWRNRPEVKERETQRTREWNEKNRDRINARKNERRKQPKQRIDMAISTAVRLHLLNNEIKKEGRSWKDLLGYDIVDLMTHLESKFDAAMTWDNYGTHWHIDHIKPKSWFLYESVDDAAFRECWALENLQPLEAKTNMSKGNRWAG